MPDGATVRRMFAGIAGRYDRANHLLSCGVDRAWRRATVRGCDLRPGERVLDVCAGTGDLAFALSRAGARVVGSDFCREMLGVAATKQRGGPRVRFVEADTLALPFATASFDLVTVAFGIRNLADPVEGMREMRRVTRPGGRVVVLEFGQTRKRVWGAVFGVYFRRLLPRLGSLITGDRQGAYAYLRDSVLEFPKGEEFLGLMRHAGLERPWARGLGGGIAMLYRGEVAR